MVYKLGDIVGRGSDGIVYELLEDNKKDKIIKFIQGDDFGIRNYLEYYILFHLDEKYISKALDIEIEEDGLIKIIQKRADMDLKDYIHKFKLNQKKKQYLSYNVCKCLDYLHSKNIIHGDIKPSNILMFKNIPKFSDFNLSRIYHKKMKKDFSMYTVTFRPPEVNNGKVFLKSDIWALGCSLFEIYYGNSYFNMRKDKKFYHIKISAEQKPENLLFNNLIESMIIEDIEKRFDIRQVLNHPYFENFKKNINFSPENNTLNFSIILEKNMKKFNIVEKNHKKIFLSKFFMEKYSQIPKKYKEIDKIIERDKFSFCLE